MERPPFSSFVQVTDIIQTKQIHCGKEIPYSEPERDCLLLLYVQKGSIFLETPNRTISINNHQAILLDLTTSISYLSLEEDTTLLRILFEATSVYFDQIVGDVFAIQAKEHHLLEILSFEAEQISFLKKCKPSITYDREIGELYNLSCLSLYTNLSQILLCFLEQNLQAHLPQEIVEMEHKLIKKHLPTQSTVHDGPEKLTPITSPRVVYDNKLVNQIIIFMRENLHQNYSIDDLAQEFLVGSSNLKKIFKKETNCSIMQYFKNLKMQEAETYIRENKLSYTEISDLLGFNSIHHFSAAFKKHFGMSPSKYYNSIQPNYHEPLNHLDLMGHQRPSGGN
jgi:AraC-like DNA-binding protein